MGPRLEAAEKGEARELLIRNPPDDEDVVRADIDAIGLRLAAVPVDKGPQHARLFGTGNRFAQFLHVFSRFMEPSDIRSILIV